jgi:hypothetical protein
MKSLTKEADNLSGKRPTKQKRSLFVGQVTYHLRERTGDIRVRPVLASASAYR